MVAFLNKGRFFLTSTFIQMTIFQCFILEIGATGLACAPVLGLAKIILYVWPSQAATFCDCQLLCMRFVVRYVKKRSQLMPLLLCAIFNIWKQSLPFKFAISDLFFTRCLPIAFTPHRQVCSRYWTWILWPNCSKFAVERDWNNRISRNDQTSGFFREIDGFSEMKNLIFFKNAACGKFFSRMRLKWYFSWKCLPTLFLRFFGQNQKKIKWEKLENMMKKQSISKKNAFIVLKGIFNNVGGRKISRR